MFIVFIRLITTVWKCKDTQNLQIFLLHPFFVKSFAIRYRSFLFLYFCPIESTLLSLRLSIFHLINYRIMDNNFKQKIDALVTEICAVTDLTHKVEILNYMEQQSSFMLWQLEDEQRIDEDSRDY